MKNFKYFLLLFLFTALSYGSDNYEDTFKSYQLGDYKNSLISFSRLAEGGDEKSAHMLGVMYSDARGCDKDLQTAFKYFTMAANKNYAPAQYVLGRIFEAGGKYDKAVAYLILSANGDYNKSKLLLAELYANKTLEMYSPKKAFKYLSEAQSEKDSVAQYTLGQFYYNGFGVKKSTKKAYTLFVKAARNGSPEAQYSLAYMYENKIWVNRDLKNSLYWYRQSAKSGFVDAIKKVIYMYEKGLGTPKNSQKSLMWKNKLKSKKI
ncbi:MAG: hypothetical protein GQ570_10685 [Helicobacteraceae bacterium]|nr:hypothetical protein [Helicobacteraceae bacterium]